MPLKILSTFTDNNFCMMLRDRVHEYALTPHRRDASSLLYTVKA